MHRILILRHDEAALARLREVLESCGEHLAIESVDDVARGLARLTTGAADGDPFAAAFVAGEAPGETLAALWAAEPDLQVVLSREAHEPVDELPDDDSGRVPLVIRRPLDAVAVRLLVRVLLEKRALQAEVRDEHECVTSLRSSNRRLEEATRAKSEFLANMSHEIRTPMTAILGYADLLREPGLPRSDFHTYLGVIRRNGDHLLRLINDILDLSKIEAGRMVLERVECSLDELLDDVMGSLRASARQKGLEFGLRLQGALPTRLSTDPVRVRQVLLNLVGNAIKFTQTGGVRVTVRMRAPENRLAIVVEDTGVGFGPDRRTTIFRAFCQADSSTTRRFGGTGLGLTISERIARLLGGAIEVDSEPGRGSRFTFTLDPGDLTDVPAVEHDAASGSERPAAPTPRSEPIDELGARILLCEDGRDNQLLLTFYLRKAGCEVTVAADGAQALDRLRGAREGADRFDVVLMDMQMPELDGYEVTATARAEGWNGPIVALTAHAMPGDREKCLAAGCDEYLTKPVDRARLIATCARLLTEREPEAPIPRETSKRPDSSELRIEDSRDAS